MSTTTAKLSRKQKRCGVKFKPHHGGQPVTVKHEQIFQFESATLPLLEARLAMIGQQQAV